MEFQDSGRKSQANRTVDSGFYVQIFVASGPWETNRIRSMGAKDFQARYDAVVVGSGHNGLVAAAYLARAGKSVLVLEKNETLGGATASERVFPDYDAWLSRYSYLVSLLPDQIVTDLGLKFQTLRRRTASFTPYEGHGGLVLSNVDEARSQASMRQMTGSDEAWGQYEKFLELEVALAAKVWPTLLSPLQSKQDFEGQMTSTTEIEAWKSFVEEPLGRAIERFADHDALRGLLMTDGKIGVFTHPHDPSLLQNRCFLYHVIGGGDGEWRVPKGGMRSLVNALLESGRTKGVDYRTGCEVQNVSVGTPCHQVTFIVDGKPGTVEAEHVLVNAGPRTFARIMGQLWTPSTDHEGSVFKMNMLLSRLPKVKAKGVTSEEAFAGSFHVDEGYAQMQTAYEASLRGEIPNPVPGEIYCHTLTDPSILSPELQAQGFQTLTLFGLDLPYRLFENDHDARREQVKDLFLDGLDRICDEPFRDCLALDSEGRPCIEYKSPQDIEKEVGLDQGNIFQSAPSWFYAPSSDEVGTWGVETEFPRVYRAGSTALRGGAVSGIPGHNAAMSVLGAK